MSKVKLAIVYYSQTGANFKMASWAKEAAEAAGAEVRLLKVKEYLDTSKADTNPAWKKYLEESVDIPEASGDDLVWADAIIFSTPTRFGNVSAQMKMFIDSLGGIWAKSLLVDKVVTAMTSAQNVNGGQEGTIKALYTTFSHRGAIIVPQGYTDASVYAQGGNPYGASSTVSHDGIQNDSEKAVKHQAERLVKITEKLIG